MKIQCIARLAEQLRANRPSLPANFQPAWEVCPPGMNGDLTINCFRLVRDLKGSPDAVTKEVAGLLSDDPDVANVEAVKAFVNVTLKPEALFRDSIADVNDLLDAVAVPEEEKKKILIEFSAPNTNKPQHLGHLRNNSIGMTLASVMKRAGHDVVPVNLINDRGIHICKSMLAYKLTGNGITPEQAGIKGDHLVGNFYVKFNQLLTDEIKELKAAHPELADKSSDDLFLETKLGSEAQNMLRKWESGDPETVALWKLMNSWVIDGFNKTYERMGVHFDKTYLESQTYLLGKDVIADALAKGIFKKRDDGAVIVDMGKLGEKVLLRKDGTSVYITQDIGTTLLKHSEHNPDTMIWVVGDEQILHFKMLFGILAKLGYKWADSLYHLAYGMVNLPGGRMKSREGTVVDADDLFDEMYALAKEAALQRLKEGAEVPADLEERSEIIGMGALKFMLLKFNPKTTIMFDPNASLKFEGDTGPYVQYVCARINSIVRKCKEAGISFKPEEIDWSLADSEEERALAVAALRYSDAIRSSAAKMDCSILVNYLLDLAKAFNRFYREKQVLNAGEPAVRNVRLAICFAVRDILADGLKTLTIGIPEAM